MHLPFPVVRRIRSVKEAPDTLYYKVYVLQSVYNLSDDKSLFIAMDYRDIIMTPVSQVGDDCGETTGCNLYECIYTLFLIPDLPA